MNFLHLIYSLHQVIQGTFKDHIVKWVQDYHATEDQEMANKILDDIDQR